jgi:ribonuclease HI
MLFEEHSHTDGINQEAILKAVEGAAHLEIAAEPVLGEVSSEESTSPPVFWLYTDGGSSPNPGPGGWAFILRAEPKGSGEVLETESAGGVPATTNNRMELTAVIRGLLHLGRPCQVTVVSDSEYVIKGLTEWLPGWKRRDWKNSRKKPVLNADLWRILDLLAQFHEVRFEWTKGHAGHPENERCDELAGRIRTEMISGGS